jgi:hypothetical protein
MREEFVGKKRECSTDRVTHGEGDDRPYLDRCESSFCARVTSIKI